MAQLQSFLILCTHDCIYLGLLPSLGCHAFATFRFSQEKHTCSSVINSTYRHLIFKGGHAAEERTCPGRLGPGPQTPGDGGSAAEHRHFAGAPSRYLKVLCGAVSLNLTRMGYTMSSVYYSFMSFLFLFFKKFRGLWFRCIYFWNWGGWKEMGGPVAELLAVCCFFTDCVVNHLHSVTIRLRYSS